MSLFDAINEAKEPSRHFFGQVTFDVWECVLRKGVGKMPFDPANDKPGEKRHAIKMLIIPTVASGLTFNIEREVISESRDWAGIILPSIHALGVTPGQLQDKFVQVEMVASRKYIAADGTEKTATLPKFIAVYQTEAECDAAAAGLFGSGGSVSTAAANGNGADPVAPQVNGNGAAAAPGMTRETALKFLPSMLAAAGGNPEMAAQILASNAILRPFFDINSPEVLEILVKATA